MTTPSDLAAPTDRASASPADTPSAQSPLEISARFAAVGMILLLAVQGGLLAKQIAFSRISTGDACGFYLPLAKAYAQGSLAVSQHPMIPPLYPLATGLLSRHCDFAEDPQEFAGQLISAASTLLLTVCVYVLGRTLVSRRVGLASAALTAVNPWMTHFGGSVGPEMPYAVFVAGSAIFLLTYSRRPSLWTAMGAGVTTGLAALTRSEGIFLVPLAAGVMLAVAVAGLVKGRRFRWQAVLVPIVHVLVLVGVVAGTWWPRTEYMREKIGYPVLDVRLVQLIPGLPAADRQWWQKANQVGQAGPKAPRESRNIDSESKSLFMVISPVTWVLAGVWLFGRRRMPRLGIGQLILLAIIVGELVMVAPVKLDRRYVATVAGLAQIWGGLGMVVLAERLRDVPGRLSEVGRSLGLQVLSMSLLLAGLACWSLLSENVGVRHGELRSLGREIRRQGGPGRVILAGTPEPIYYADGKLVRVAESLPAGQAVSREQLLRICQEWSVDYIVVRSRESWCPWLGDEISSGRLPRGRTMVMQDSSGKKSGRITSYLIDARNLFALPTTSLPAP